MITQICDLCGARLTAADKRFIRLVLKHGVVDINIHVKAVRDGVSSEYLDVCRLCKIDIMKEGEVK